MFKDGKPVSLTKEEAVELHRQMWRDMVNELGENPSFLKRIDFKEIWIATHGFSDVYSDCFLCEYKYQENERCYDCLINWGVSQIGIPRRCYDGVKLVGYDSNESYFNNNLNDINYKYSPVSVVAEAPLKEAIRKSDE